MNHLNRNWDEYTFKNHLRQVYYWFNRFEFSRNVDHLDHAERHADVVREYLPKCFQNLNFFGLCNLYQSLSSLSNLDRPGD